MLSRMTRRAPVRRSRLGRALLVALVVLVGLLVAADRIGVLVAERAAATTLQRSQHLAQRPSVSIGGFPFLTQLATGNFDHVHVTADNLTLAAGNSQLRVARLDVTLRHVHVSRDFTSARSQFSTATALIHYPDLSRTLGTQLSYAGGGRVRASAAVGVIPGVAVPGTATAAVHVKGDALVFDDVQVSIAGQAVPSALSSYFTGLFGTAVSLSGLPFGVHVQSVDVQPGGVTIALSAAGLTFHR
jgi:hypothetical protein